jgi:micrococcal nuclease
MAKHQHLKSCRLVAAVLITMALVAPLAAEAEPALARGERGTVARVLDGDSLVLADGLVVRLAAVEAPRLRSSDAASVGARAALEGLVAGQPVELAYDGLRRDSRGRAIAHVFVRDRQGRRVWVQQALLEAGQARVHTYADNRAGVVDLWTAERSARRAGRGLWQVPAYQIRHATPTALASDARSFQLVEGPVVSAERRGTVIQLHFGEDAATDVTAVIPEQSFRLWDGGEAAILALQGRVIRVRGFVRNSSGPMIWVDHPEQVEYMIANPRSSVRNTPRSGAR